MVCVIIINIIVKKSHLDGLSDGDPLSVHGEEGRVLRMNKTLDLKGTEDWKC